MSDWEIKKPLGECAGTGETIDPGQEFFAALVENEDGLERCDFSLEYWENNNPKVYYFWKTRMPDPNEKKQMFIDDDMLLAFFDRLENETAQDKINFRYVLCLILMRKRLLKYISSFQKDDSEVWELRVTGQKRQVQVVDPRLTEDQLDDLTANVGQILQMDMD